MEKVKEIMLSQELNFILFRPYKNIIRCVESLSVEHLTNMKFSSSYLLMAIAQEMEWYDFGIEVDKTNLTFLYYLNNRKPYYRFLLEYYTEVFIKNVKSGGGEIDVGNVYDELYNENCLECAKNDYWTSAMCVNHQLFLLHYDKWYKRKFRPYRRAYLDNYSMYDSSGLPRQATLTTIRGKIYEE